MKSVNIFFFIVVFCIFLGCQQKTNHPNIIFIVADDMYPYMFNNLIDTSKSGISPNLTPNMDRLISEGVWLENMRVVSPVCTPSRYNVLTGNYASRSVTKSFLKQMDESDGQSVIQWNSYITPGVEKTMGSYFQDLGYITGFVGKNHVIEYRPVPGRNKGLNLDDDPYDPRVKEELKLRYSDLQAEILKCGFDYADGLYHNNPNWLGVNALASHNTDWIVSNGMDFIENNSEHPFLLYLATTIPHGPTGNRRSWMADRRITPKGILDQAPNVLPTSDGPLTPEQDSIAKLDPGLEPTIRNYRSIYQRIKDAGLLGKKKENLLWLDDAIGALYKKLENEGLLENTIIVFFNDHGQEQKGTLYEGGLKTQAFIWKKGGFEAGSKLKQPLGNVDFLPTLLEMAGADVNEDNFDGYSFKKALDGKEYNAREVSYHELGYARAVIKDSIKYYAVRFPQWALQLTAEERKKMLDEHNEMKRKVGRPIINEDPMAPFGQLVMIPGGELAENPAYTSVPNYHDPDQLYDLRVDPNETKNVIDDPRYAEKVLDMKEILMEKVTKLPGTFDVYRVDEKLDKDFLD